MCLLASCCGSRYLMQSAHVSGTRRLLNSLQQMNNNNNNKGTQDPVPRAIKRRRLDRSKPPPAENRRIPIWNRAEQRKVHVDIYSPGLLSWLQTRMAGNGGWAFDSCNQFLIVAAFFLTYVQVSGFTSPMLKNLQTYLKQVRFVWGGHSRARNCLCRCRGPSRAEKRSVPA